MSQALATEIDVAQSLDIDSEFYQDVIDGLSSEQKTLSPKYFYDDAGSRYFDEICKLDEYYPYKTELKLLPRVVKDIASRFLKPLSIVEFGAGSLLKIRPLLEDIQSVCEFVPIDISGEHLRQACSELQQEFPRILMTPTAGDFTQPVELGVFRGQRMGFFPGSTIGNFTPEDAADFLSSAKKTLGKEAYMLIGVDTKKSPDLLHKAYNDAKGVTAKFNLNILDRINRELDANIDKENFEHYAFYNTEHGRVEMHLVSKNQQKFTVNGSEVVLQTGESIHTECSYKYAPSEFQTLANKAGWSLVDKWLAEDDMFSMYLLENG